MSRPSTPPVRPPASTVPGVRHRAVILASLALVALPALLAAQVLQVETSPQVPTWRDTIQVIVSGTVMTSCGPQIVALGNVRYDGGSLVDLDLTAAPCDVLAPPVAHSFTVDALLPSLGPGTYSVRVHDLVLGGTTSTEVVVRNVGALELTVPDAARSDEAVRLLVRGWASCPFAGPPQVEGRLITVEVSAECHILPPGPQVFELEVEVGPLPAGAYEVQVIDHITPAIDQGNTVVKGTLRVWDADGCVPSANELCLVGGRFRVTATWRDFAARTGAGRAVRLPGNETSGLFWFFAPDNTELTVKVLDGCGFNDRWWAFVSSASTVAFDVTVTDTATGVQRQFHNDLGVAPPLLANTSAFACP